VNKKPARALTPRQKFVRYLEKMLHWQRTREPAAQRAWLAQGQHTGGKRRVAMSATDEGQRIKNKRTGWLWGWRARIHDDAALTTLANEAGVLDKPRHDAQPGDFANPDPRVYKWWLVCATCKEPYESGPPACPKCGTPEEPPQAEELPPTVSLAAWSLFRKGK
jgi:hypothetical protein